MSLLVVGEQRMRALNRQHRGVDRPTDILSFALLQPGEPLPAHGPALLGDLILCLPVARRQARRLGHDLRHELAVLLTHGLLHLLGQDHATPAQARAMAELEMCVLAAVGVPPELALVGRTLG